MVRATVACTILGGASFAQLAVVPTTTLTAQTANNTSAANTFNSQSNGNLGAGNISKEPINDLIPNGQNVKVFAHYMPWWGKSGHINIGYSEHDPAQIKRQVEDMISRGFAGVIVAESNSSTWSLDTTKLLFAEVERHPGFLFVVQENKGALSSASDPTAKLISDMTYANDHYFSSPNYYRINGRPVVPFYDGTFSGMDWSKAQANSPGNPIFVFRNSGGYSHTASGGAFAWIGSTSSTDPSGLNYVKSFYSESLNHPGKIVLGSGWKGFNDTLASWGKNRIVPQRCGQTWLDSMATLSKYYSGKGDPVAMQINTWNDYEEGTELESGVDNCVSLSASMSGTSLNWSIGSGNEKGVSHYNVYVSLDGSNLMKLTELATGNRTLNVGSYSLAGGTYKLFVQAVGKNSFRNKMSSAVTYTVGGGSSSPTPTPTPTPTTDRTITVTAPVASSTYSTSVNVAATATSPRRVTGLKVYVDGTMKASSSTGTLSATVSMSKGTRQLTFKAWDASGALWKKSFSITVQ
jgi:hypothetical protein